MEDSLENLKIEEGEAEFGGEKGGQVGVVADGVEIDGEKMRILRFYYLPLLLLVHSIR